MTFRSKLVCLVAGMVPLGGTGCIIVADGKWCCGPTVWTTERTDKLSVSSEELKGLDIQTHNGWVHVTGQSDPAAQVSITATKKTGGLTLGDAERAMDALQVYAEAGADGVVRVGYRWKGLKSPTWGATVNFDVQVPANVRLDVETHNGRVEVTDIRGDVAIETHNGEINVVSSEGRLHAETHNGSITANYAGSDITLVSHNGRIVSNLGNGGPIRGSISTHNGGVELAVGENTSTDLTCRTHNGGITFDVPVVTKKASRRQLVGTLGEGGRPFDVTTHNGSIRLTKAAG